MISIPQQYRYILILNALCAIGLILGVSWYVAKERTVYTEALDAQIEETRTTLRELATLTNRNEAPPAVDVIIRDCAQRGKFESLLGQLRSLSQSELGTASQYFDACADYFAVKKGVAVMFLEREYQSLADTVALRQGIDPKGRYEELRSVWSEIVLLEKERAAQLSLQVMLQKRIISILQDGRPETAIADTMAEAEIAMATLTKAAADIEALRAEEAKITILP